MANIGDLLDDPLGVLGVPLGGRHGPDAVDDVAPLLRRLPVLLVARVHEEERLRAQMQQVHVFDAAGGYRSTNLSINDRSINQITIERRRAG